MPTRFQAADLRDAARKANVLRAELAEKDGGSGELYLDIEVVIDVDAASAFRAVEGQAANSCSALRYVGTPRGLAGLIADVQRLGIADGVVLKTSDEARVVDLMLGELAPGLGSQRVSA
jgi:hypothetical protein